METSILISQEKSSSLQNGAERRIEWFESLPEKCPPGDAEPCNGTYYRIISSKTPSAGDFLSQRSLQPEKHFIGNGVDDCIVHALSVFGVVQDAVRRLKLPKFRFSSIVMLHLEPKDGVMKKTFSDSHYSWWRSTEFDFNGAQTV